METIQGQVSPKERGGDKGWSFAAAELISRIEKPLFWSAERSEAMVRACREMALFHQENSNDLKALYRRRGFDPNSIRSESDLARIPSVDVTAMKHFLMTSLPHDRCVLRLTSSGTGGQKTQIWFDQPSLDRVQMMLETLWLQEGLVSDEPTNYILFVYDPDEAKDLGVAFSDKNQQRFAPVAKTFHAVKKSPSTGQWEFRLEETIAAFEGYVQEGRPIRFFGIPSFFFEFIVALEKKHSGGQRPHYRVHPASLVMTGGGWKAAEDKKVSREEFRTMISRVLGLSPDRIRDGYGMAEHCAPYIECREHRFHIPAYCRIFIRNPVNMEALGPGQIGLVELVSPWNAMMPNLSVLSTDLGVVDPEPCPCGVNAPTFRILGRAGLSKHKGCALHADDIVKRGESK